MSDGNADLLVREGFFEVVSQTLCGHTYGVDIHAVRTDAHDASQAACAEFEVFVEAFREFVYIVVHQVFDLLFCLLVIVSREPFFGSLSNKLIHVFAHHTISFTYKNKLYSVKKVINKGKHNFLNTLYQTVKF